MANGIDDVDKELFERIWKIITEIGVAERHFNSIQSGYRNMASAWLLATFGGMGFAFVQNFQVQIDREIVFASVALAGSIGIMLLWILDLLVYHRLLDSCFVEGLILEMRHPWLPPFRNNMMETQQQHGVLSKVVGFYLLPAVLLLVLASGGITLWLVRMEQTVSALLALIGGLALAFGISALMLWKTSDRTWIERKLAEAHRLSSVRPDQAET